MASQTPHPGKSYLGWAFAAAAAAVLIPHQAQAQRHTTIPGPHGQPISGTVLWSGQAHNPTTGTSHMVDVFRPDGGNGVTTIYDHNPQGPQPGMTVAVPDNVINGFHKGTLSWNRQKETWVPETSQNWGNKIRQPSGHGSHNGFKFDWNGNTAHVKEIGDFVRNGDHVTVFVTNKSFQEQNVSVVSSAVGAIEGYFGYSGYAIPGMQISTEQPVIVGAALPPPPPPPVIGMQPPRSAHKIIKKSHKLVKKRPHVVKTAQSYCACAANAKLDTLIGMEAVTQQEIHASRTEQWQGFSTLEGQIYTLQQRAGLIPATPQKGDIAPPPAAGPTVPPVGPPANMPPHSSIQSTAPYHAEIQPAAPNASLASGAFDFAQVNEALKTAKARAADLAANTKTGATTYIATKFSDFLGRARDLIVPPLSSLTAKITGLKTSLMQAPAADSVSIKLPPITTNAQPDQAPIKFGNVLGAFFAFVGFASVAAVPVMRRTAPANAHAREKEPTLRLVDRSASGMEAEAEAIIRKAADKGEEIKSTLKLAGKSDDFREVAIQVMGRMIKIGELDMDAFNKEQRLRRPANSFRADPNMRIRLAA